MRTLSCLTLLFLPYLVGCGSGPRTAEARASFHQTNQQFAVVTELFAEKADRLSAALKDEKLAHVGTITEHWVSRKTNPDGSMKITATELKTFMVQRDTTIGKANDNFYLWRSMTEGYKSALGAFKEADAEMRALDTQDALLGGRWRLFGQQMLNVTRVAAGAAMGG